MPEPRSSNVRNAQRRIEDATWPLPMAGEALCALARASGLPVADREITPTPPGLSAEQLGWWIEALAEGRSVQATQIDFSLAEIPALVAKGAPLLLRVKTQEGEGFVAIAGARRKAALLVGPDLRTHRIRVAALAEHVARPVEQSLRQGVDALLERVSLESRRRARASAALISDRMKAVRFRTGWLLRLPPGSKLRKESQEIQLGRHASTLLAAHAIQYLLFVASWWLLGRGVLDGTFDGGWLIGWSLLLFSLIPFRLLATWFQGLLTTTAGAWLRRRLLRGALQVPREDLRRKGAGQLFGMAVETGAIEGLALSGGVAALFSLLELTLAILVLWSGGGLLPGLLLGLCAAAVLGLGIQYLTERRIWTRERLSMTHQLLEAMVGHRTRLAQQPPEEWHVQEDSALARYVDSARAMDRSSIWLTGFVPRAWLAVAVASLIPAVVGQAAPARLAISVGGILLAYRSLRRLSAGLSSLAGAVIAAESVRPLAAAATSTETAPQSPLVLRRHQSSEATDGFAIQACDLFFRYPGQAEPVLQGSNLSIPRGTHVLLEGPSGAGKTTLASVLAGLETPDSGLLLADGYDRSVLGPSGWRQRVVLAPQARDNFLFGGSLAFNLLMGRRWPALPADLADADAVCRELGLGDLLDRLPGGLHQMVGETGWQLSQGERARVFLARALLQNPDVLVLDEGFAALDSENVDRAARCLLRRAQTVLAIAHV
jgi:ATP-binding cassette subfamily B protein